MAGERVCGGHKCKYGCTPRHTAAHRAATRPSAAASSAAPTAARTQLDSFKGRPLCLLQPTLRVFKPCLSPGSRFSVIELAGMAALTLPPAVAGTLENLALLAIGYNLRRAGLFDVADAKVGAQRCSAAACRGRDLPLRKLLAAVHAPSIPAAAAPCPHACMPPPLPPMRRPPRRSLAT